MKCVESKLNEPSTKCRRLNGGRIKMKYEEIMKELRAGKQCLNNNWNGLKIGNKIMYLSLQNPGEGSLITEPYIMFHSGIYEGEEPNGGWAFKRFPWTPSALDLMSEGWVVRVRDTEPPKLED